MPARARTSDEAVVAAGRELLEARGLDAVTMHAVAECVGVRGPSLYKRVANRQALIAAIERHVLDEIRGELAAADDGGDPATSLRRIADAYRGFAHRYPHGYGLIFARLPADAHPAADEYARAAEPLLTRTAQLVGPDRALEAGRLLTAFVHGFVTMELAGAFRLGGDPDLAFEYGISTLLDALGADAASPRGRAREP